MRAALIDPNLLVLLMIERVDPRLVERHKRLGNYTRELRQAFTSKLSEFPRHCSTPHILTETSNLVRQTHQGLAMRAMESLAHYIRGQLDEIFEPSNTLAGTSAFSKFGLADAAVLGAATGDVTVFTDDSTLYQLVWDVGGQAINVHHYQTPKGLR